MLELFKEVKEILGLIGPLIVGLLFLVYKTTKNSKLKGIAESFIQIETIIKEYMCNAELFFNYNGKDKKEWVKTKVNQFCIENKISYNEETVDNLIENFIVLTKSVNKRNKDEVGLL